jgi:hypothetical protein
VTDVLSGMASLFTARTTKYKLEYVSKIPAIPERVPVGETIITGSYSQTWKKAGVRYMLLDKTVLMPYGRPTITDVSRDYLTAKYPVRRIRRDQGKMLKQHPPALFTNPGFYKDMVYLDVRSAYWTIIKIVGWDVDLWPGKWIGVGQTMSDFPLPTHKVCRNSLHGVALPSWMVIYTSTGRHSIRTFNKLLNLQLHEVIACVQHSIALFAVNECGACYFNTDGAIIPAKMAKKYVDYVNSWGLSLSLEHVGDTIIITSGSYKIGDYQTKRYSTVKKPRHLNNLRPFAWSDWLYAKMPKFGVRRGVPVENKIGKLLEYSEKQS